MGARRHQTEILIFAVLLVGAGCGGSDTKLLPALDSYLDDANQFTLSLEM